MLEGQELYGSTHLNYMFNVKRRKFHFWLSEKLILIVDISILFHIFDACDHIFCRSKQSQNALWSLLGKGLLCSNISHNITRLINRFRPYTRIEHFKSI
jgi:hypothetical protein